MSVVALLSVIVPPLAMFSRDSLPPRLRVAPEAIVTPEEDERRPSPTVSNLPALTVVAPAKVLAWESVSVPAPSLTREPLATVLANSTGATTVRT